MPFDEAKRRAQQIRDTAPRVAQRSHPGFEESVPPAPIENPYGEPLAAPASAASPSVDHYPRVERHVRWWKLAATWIGAAGVIGGAVIGVVSWAGSLVFNAAKANVLKDADKQCAAIAASAAASAVGPYPYRIEQLEKREAKDEARWDGLDAVNEETAKKEHRREPTKFGPGAEARGDVNLWTKKGKP